MLEILLLVILGLSAGFLSGSLGIGGGLIIIPALVYFLNMSQHGAQGTSLAFMLPPISILAVMQYAKHGDVNWKYAGIISLLFIVGAYFGSLIVVHIPSHVLKKIFGVFMMIVAVKMIFGK